MGGAVGRTKDRQGPVVHAVDAGRFFFAVLFPCSLDVDAVNIRHWRVLPISANISKGLLCLQHVWDVSFFHLILPLVNHLPGKD